MLYHDRTEAAQLLALRLSGYRGMRPLVLGVPRAGVIMARVIADELGGDADVALVRKLRAPDEPDLTIGAVTENGSAVVSDRPFVRALPSGYVEAEREMALGLLRRQREIYTPGRPATGARGRIVIVADDGVTTGLTMEAELRSLRESGAARTVVAAAVSPPEAADFLRGWADEVVCLAQAPEPGAVSRFFLDFTEVSDAEVVSALGRSEARRAG